jgi:hypothetical protein
MEERLMNANVATIRELTLDETALVGGAWTWTGLGGAMLTGGIVGGLGAAATGAGIPLGALGGALLGGAGYLINDFFVNCF